MNKKFALLGRFAPIMTAAAVLAVTGSEFAAGMDLKIAPATTNVTVIQGESASNSCQVWNAGPETIDYTVSANQPWLGLSTASGVLTGETENATNTIWISYINTADLPVGDHFGTVTVATTNGGGSTASLEVTLSVQPPLLLAVNPMMLTNAAVMEGQNLDPQTVLVWNASADAGFGYEVTVNTNWLTATAPTNFLDPLTTNAVVISYNVAALAAASNWPASYLGAITVTATSQVSGLPVNGSPVIIPVTVRVNPKARLALSLTNLAQTIRQGQDALSQGFDVWNASGFYTLNYAITKDAGASWLVPLPSGGSSTSEHDHIEVEYSTANLPAGLTSAVITVVGRTWDGADMGSALDATQRIFVALSITPFAALASDAQTVYALPPVRVGSTPADTVFHVWNGSVPLQVQGAMHFAVQSSAGWVTAAPANGSVAGGSAQEIRLQYANTAGMAPGTYNATIQVNATDAESGLTAYGSPFIILVNLAVKKLSGFNFQGGAATASDLVVYREETGDWAIGNLQSEYRTNLVFGGQGFQPVPGDYIGNGVTDFGVYRPVNGSWYVWQTGEGSLFTRQVPQWVGTGLAGVQGDYDGDGRIDLAVYVEAIGWWSVLTSGSGYTTFWSGKFPGQASGPGYAALPAGDYDGDGKADFGLYHRASGWWRLLFSGSDYAEVAGGFGNGLGFLPVPADYNGDGFTDPAVYETGTGYWSILLSSPGSPVWWRLMTCLFGGVEAPGFVPAPADYDGDGGADLALYDTIGGNWYISTTNNNWIAQRYHLGGFGYRPVLP